MNSNISIRIQEVIKMFDETQDSFSLRTKTSRTAISKWVNKNAEPSFHNIFNILAAYPTINANWLITGEGNRTLVQNDGMVSEPQAMYNTTEKQTLQLLKTELEKAWNEVDYHKNQVQFFQNMIEHYLKNGK